MYNISGDTPASKYLKTNLFFDSVFSIKAILILPSPLSNVII